MLCVVLFPFGARPKHREDGNVFIFDTEESEISLSISNVSF
jgi:hypothetical protein